MNIETQKKIHKLRRDLDLVNTCFNCIVIDLSNSKNPKAYDVQEVLGAIKNFEGKFKELFQTITTEKCDENY
ncbi:MAG: hypothetical protein QE271_11945 [Bacteriovoracaceae bacterium]|nr:hypothetical protein [Bacteriovoracaceae bacterium]